MTLYTNIFDSDKKAFFLGYLTFEDGIITSVSDTFTGEYEDYSSSYAVPGFVDIHTHGGAGVDLSSPVGIDFDALGRYYLSKGVTTYLPSTTSCPHNDLMDTIAAVKAAMAKKSAVPRSRIAGIHIEGPYINPKRAGAHALDRIRTPKDWEIDEIIGASDGMTLYMTIAPELDNALNTIRRMTSAGARISIGHTDASAEQVYEGILAGAVNFTHTFNAMPALHHPLRDRSESRCRTAVLPR